MLWHLVPMGCMCLKTQVVASTSKPDTPQARWEGFPVCRDLQNPFFSSDEWAHLSSFKWAIFSSNVGPIWMRWDEVILVQQPNCWVWSMNAWCLIYSGCVDWQPYMTYKSELSEINSFTGTVLTITVSSHVSHCSPVWTLKCQTLYTAEGLSRCISIMVHDSGNTVGKAGMRTGGRRKVLTRRFQHTLAFLLKILPIKGAVFLSLNHLLTLQKLQVAVQPELWTLDGMQINNLCEYNRERILCHWTIGPNRELESI